MSIPYPQQTPPGPPACYRHFDRPAYVGCTRCGRPVCGECMRAAAVGHHCPDCVQAAVVAAPRVRVRSGATPVITYTLIAVNVAVFLLQIFAPESQARLELWPPAVAGGDYYRLVTSAFVHYGILHILFNMYALYVLGPPLERHLGRPRFGALYALSAMGGSVVVYLFSPTNVSTAGASGAIFGLFGATLVGAKQLNLDMRWLVTLIVLNMAITFTFPGVSWQGHLGGLVTGVAVGAAYFHTPRALAQAGVSLALVAVFLALISWRTAELVDQFGSMLNHR